MIMLKHVLAVAARCSAGPPEILADIVLSEA